MLHRLDVLPPLFIQGARTAEFGGGHNNGVHVKQ